MAKTNKEIVEEEIGKVKALDKECKCGRDDHIFLEFFGRAIAKAVRQETAQKIYNKYVVWLKDTIPKSMKKNCDYTFRDWLRKYLSGKEVENGKM